jgi:chitin synthase
MIIAMLSLVTSYISPALTFYILLCTIEQIDLNLNYVAVIARIISIIYILFYIIAIGGSLMGGLWTKYAQYVSICFGVFTYILLAMVCYNIIFVYLNLSGNGVDLNNFSQMSILVMILVNLGIFFLILIIHLVTHPQLVWRLMVDQFSYISYQGAYTQTMVIHAFCNVDDVSWGTKGTTTSHGAKKYETEKIRFVSSW